MKLAAYTLSYWDNADKSAEMADELSLWKRHVYKIASPCCHWVSCGTFSDPKLCPIDSHVINANIEKTRIYNPMNWGYSLAAEEAALWHFIINTDCDAVMYLCSDGFLRNPVHSLIDAFMESDKLIMAFNWGEWIDDSFFVMKRESAVRYLNGRLRPNLSVKTQIMSETEKTEIFKGYTFNPKPTKKHYRYPGVLPQPSYEEVIKHWPICIKIPKDLIQRYAGHLL